MALHRVNIDLPLCFASAQHLGSHTMLLQRLRSKQLALQGHGPTDYASTGGQALCVAGAAA